MENCYVRVSKADLIFSAAHFITLGPDQCEGIHGHNYRVTAEVHGPLDENGCVVDFCAAWCGPCKQIAHILHESAEAVKGKVNIDKINSDDNPNARVRYGVRGIPTLMLFNDGNVQGTKVGAVNKAKLTEFIDEHLD